MASICHRCALRLQRAAQADTRHAIRTFSSTSNAQGQLPSFKETSNEELNHVLADLRNKHFIPAYLSKPEQRMIYRRRYKQQIEDNPTTAYAGGEEVDLQWLDRRKDIPNRGALVRQALDIMLKGENQDWQNLPALLQGLKEGVKKPLDDNLAEKLIRKSLSVGKFGSIILCLQSAYKTGLTLKNEVVLKNVLIALHQLAQGAGWSKSATGKALRDVNVIATQLESEEHGTGRLLSENDPRTRPEVLGLFLELAAVYAYKFEDAKDVTGLVKVYAQRLASCLEKSGTEPRDLVLLERSPQHPFLLALPVWHGLNIAQSILGKDMPQPRIVQETMTKYHAALSQLASELEARNPQPGTYDDQALTAWKACIRS